MSVTVEKILKLPSMRGATVLAGKDHLDKIVNSISVLEYAKRTKTQKLLFEKIEFLGGELALTSFSSIVDDVEAQCANIQQMAAVGEVGLVLYYVGLVLPKVDRRLIEVSEKMGFVLICMPENDPGLRYSELICEAMDIIVRDQINSSNFSLDLLEQMSKLPGNQRTVDSMLQLVSIRLRATVVVADGSGQILSAAMWPRNQKPCWDSWMSLVPASDNGVTFVEVDEGHGLWIYRGKIQSEAYHNMMLLVFSEGVRMDNHLWKQTLDGVCLGMNIWGREHDQIGLLELVRAIIRDEPIKMRRIADIYNIDVAALSDMWIIQRMGDGQITHCLGDLRELSQEYANVCLCERYEEDILIFPEGTSTLADMDEWAEAIVEYCEKKHISAVLTRCNNLRNTADVKNAYYTNQTYIMDAKTVFPHRKYFTLPEIEFVKQCKEIANQGESSIGRYMSILKQVAGGRDGEEILHTLAVYLLDKSTNVTDTAQALYVHKNTVKYRLQKAGAVLGFRIGDMPHSQNLMYAVALRRLLRRR